MGEYFSTDRIPVLFLGRKRNHGEVYRLCLQADDNGHYHDQVQNDKIGAPLCGRGDAECRGV